MSKAISFNRLLGTLAATLLAALLGIGMLAPAAAHAAPPADPSGTGGETSASSGTTSLDLVNLEKIDQNAKGTITLDFHYEGAPLAGVKVSAYRIAQAKRHFPALPAYQQYLQALKWNDFQDKSGVIPAGSVDASKWAEFAGNLANHIQADQVTPDVMATSDSNGNATFNNLEVGVYLLLADPFTSTAASGETYVFNPSLVTVPSLVDGKLQYGVNAVAKLEKVLPKPAQYRVVKHWQDGGNQESRPRAVKIQILRDEKLFQTIELNSENNWSYRWEDSEGHRWAVAEQLGNTPYTVSYEKLGQAFTVTNTLVPKNPPKRPPLSKTGANLNYLWLAPLLMVLGAGGIAARRRQLVAAGSSDFKSESATNSRQNRADREAK
ncbi:Cna B-type domain-containing protein [uncultured Varibaculum sp.]|uniref:Cna B-type domain-containing protein n=1 Tax=uncultured Varibaculum sp. TaxID=413896 RepID=UPI0027D94758|nr:Cna B-type domain-containing protein [uncultured Varibaculum sp.]